MSKPIAVVMTDLHVEDDNTKVCIDIAKQCVDLAVSLGVKLIINAGDTFNSRKSQTLSSIIAVKTILDYCSDMGVDMVAIDGNHDKLMYNSKDSYMDAFSSHSALILIKDEMFNITQSNGKVIISVVSFFSDNNQCTSNENYISLLKKVNSSAKAYKKSVDKNSYHILVTHNGFSGARTNSGVPIESDIDPEIVDSFDRVLVGHYHDESYIGKTIHYIGACRQAWFTENKKKGFTVINSDGSIRHEKSIQKEYTEIPVEMCDDYSKAVAKAVKLLNSEFKNDYKRLNLICDRATVKSIDIPSIKSMGVDVRVTDVTTSVAENGEIDNSEGFEYVNFDSEKIAGLFMEFCEEEGVNDEDLEYGLEVLGKTINNK